MYFLFNRTTLQVFVTYLTGALYVHPLWFYKYQHENRVHSRLFVACQRWWFQWRFWFVPSVLGEMHNYCTLHIIKENFENFRIHRCNYTGCPRRNVPDFGRVLLMLKYTDITQNTYVQSWTVTEIMAREDWNFDSCYTLIDYEIHTKTGRNMWFL